MSTLRTNTLSNASGSKSVPVDTVVDGSAKALVNFNGTGTVAIRAAFNVTSITDNGTGDYTVNLTTAMPDANYAVKYSAGGGGGANYTHLESPYGQAPTTSAVRVRSADFNGIAVDYAYEYVAVFR